VFLRSASRQLRARPAGAQGLEEQLLNVVARHERPELEAERGALAARVGADRAQLAALEAALLSGLARASGNILDNQARRRAASSRPSHTPDHALRHSRVRSACASQPQNSRMQCVHCGAHRQT
jgi:hypothetical protein